MGFDIESISVAQSRKWKAEEIAEDLIDGIDNDLEEPQFLLFFSTTHHAKEYEKILSQLKAAYPETPLIGSSIAGFTTREGVFSRGNVIFALEHEKMDVAIAKGHHTKILPERAGRKCGSTISEELSKSEYENRALVNMISAPIIPELPLIGKINRTDSNLVGFLLTRFGLSIASLLGTGLGKEVDVIEGIAGETQDFMTIGGSAVDNGQMEENYLFFEDKVITNAVVGLGIATDFDITLESRQDLEKTGKEFEITKSSSSNRIVKKIEKKPAREYFVEEILNITESQFQDLGAFYYKAADYFPITFKEREDRVIGIGAFLGDNLLMSHKIGGSQAELLSVKGDEFLSSLDKILEDKTGNRPFLGFYSAIYNFLSGREMYRMKDKLDDKMGDTPYLILNPIIENRKEIGEKPSLTSYSLNNLSFGGE